jgi:hypothetical protein
MPTEPKDTNAQGENPSYGVDDDINNGSGSVRDKRLVNLIKRGNDHQDQQR